MSKTVEMSIGSSQPVSFGIYIYKKKPKAPNILRIIQLVATDGDWGHTAALWTPEQESMLHSSRQRADTIAGNADKYKLMKAAVQKPKEIVANS